MEHNIFLKKLDDQDLPNLILKTEKHLPGSLTVLSWLTARMKYGPIRTPVTNAYVPVNDNIPYFVAIVHLTSSKEESVLLYWDLANINDNVAMKLLRSIPDLVWADGILLAATSCKILTKMQHFMKTLQLGGPNIQHKILTKEMALVPKPERMPHYELESGFRIDVLQPYHADKIYSNWEYPESDTLANLREYISSYPSLGIFMQPGEIKSIDPQYLVSWVITKNDGSLGCTYTLPPFRGRKFASILTQKLAKYHIMNNSVPYILSGYHNPLAIAVHTKLGCEPVSESFGWEYYRT